MKESLNRIKFKEQWPKPVPVFVEVKLMDQQWHEINGYVALPQSARAQIQNAINDYRFESQATYGHSSPWQVRAELERFAGLAQQLKQGLYKPISTDIMMAIGAVDREPGPYAHASYVTHYNEVRKQAGALLGVLRKALHNVEAKPPGADITRVDGFVGVLDDIYYGHTGKHLNRGKISLKFISDISAIADSGIGGGSIHGALVRRGQQIKAK